MNYMNDFLIQPHKIDEDFLLEISNKTGVYLDQVKYIFRHNVMSIDQMAFLLRRSRMVINYALQNKIDSKTNKEIEPSLTSINPFQTAINPGQTLIVIDDKCIEFIKHKLRMVKFY